MEDRLSTKRQAMPKAMAFDGVKRATVQVHILDKEFRI